MPHATGEATTRYVAEQNAAVGQYWRDVLSSVDIFPLDSKTKTDLRKFLIAQQEKANQVTASGGDAMANITDLTGRVVSDFAAMNEAATADRKSRGPNAVTIEELDLTVTSNRAMEDASRALAAAIEKWLVINNEQ